MSSRVVDASALLAYVDDEPGAEVVERCLPDGLLVSAVNWAEVLSKLAERGVAGDQFEEELTSAGILGESLEVRPFRGEDAVTVARLRLVTRALGFSLADRACLALGLRSGLSVLTADRVWGEASLPVRVELIR